MIVKKEVKIIIIVIVLIFVVIFRFNIRYFIDGGKNADIAAPDAFYFDLASGKHMGELYYLSNETYSDIAHVDGYDEANNTYHLYVDKFYLQNNDALINITGSYWNYPYKPTIKIDGKVVDDKLISTNDTGYANGLFSEEYISKNYHFDFIDKIIPEHSYEIYVRCSQNSESINIVFHRN